MGDEIITTFRPGDVFVRYSSTSPQLWQARAASAMAKVSEKAL